MNYFKTCPHCGAHLDPCECCDCQNSEKASVSVTSTDRGTAEQVSEAVSASHDTRETADCQMSEIEKMRRYIEAGYYDKSRPQQRICKEYGFIWLDDCRRKGTVEKIDGGKNNVLCEK